MPLPGHPEQAVDGEPELAHPPEHLAVQVHVRDQPPAKGEESHSELCAGSSHDEKVDRSKVGSCNTDALGHESSIWLGGLALPVDQTPYQCVPTSTGDHSDREAEGLRPVGAGQESVVDLVDKSVSGDNNNTSP